MAMAAPPTLAGRRSCHGAAAHRRLNRRLPPHPRRPRRRRGRARGEVGGRWRWRGSCRRLAATRWRGCGGAC
ncbi:Os09g0499201 [Oryza sativa Japonica Group]|uniref:Os09g0499201 protein n=1 Tax=Oryza sativa subsp. japonica TaxID=39947 RepID=A0A0P0XNP5_ORYSJ|nr:hypothetical protein EE612_048742 [Oryza sativa]BAT08799.1 Os09g0499201 [Oryza sativa Japonica Group]